MKKKIITLCLVIAMLSVAVIGGTLAYFTDVDQATNVFTVGKVTIDLYETVGHKDAANHDKSNLIKVDGETGKTLTDINKGPEDTAFTVTYGPAMPGDTLTKVITVENDGTEPAYVAIAIKQENYDEFNAAIDGYYEPMYKAELLGEKPEATDAEIYAKQVEEMQAIMDEMFAASGWNRPMYDKKTNGTISDYITTGVRYYPEFVGDKAIGIDNTGAVDHYGLTEPTLLGVDYVVSSNEGGNVVVKGYAPMLGTAVMSDDGLIACERVWIYYVYLPGNTTGNPANNAKYTMDISVKVPARIDENSIVAFDNMILDVQASAIQATGFQNAKAAYTELNATYSLGF